jgi:hypothetical protein
MADDPAGIPAGYSRRAVCRAIVHDEYLAVGWKLLEQGTQHAR